MTVNGSDNRYGVAQLIVAPTIAEGANYTTIASALTAASSSQTIFIRPGTYTENLTLKAGVNLTAFGCDSSKNATGHVIISGTCTLTTAGSVTISGIQLQTNSAALLAVTGSAASIVNLENCYLNCTNNTGITYSSSSASSAINISDSAGDLGTTGIGLFAHSSAGMMNIQFCNFSNSGASLTASTASAGELNLFFCYFKLAITTSGTNLLQNRQCHHNTSSINTTSLTIGGSGTNIMRGSTATAGTASTMSIGSSLICDGVNISSTNTNAITGAGTIEYNDINFGSTSSTVNTTTQTPLVARYGHTRSTLQPAYLAIKTGGSANATGDGTVVTIIGDSEIFDQNADYNTGTGVFTAPLTGRYRFAFFNLLTVIGAQTILTNAIVTSNRSYECNRENPAATKDPGNNALSRGGSILGDMDSGDTMTFTVTVTGGTKTITVNESSISCQLEF